MGGVEVMAGLRNRRRRLVVRGQPVATGVVAVGDSAVCTNPVYGWGCSLAVAHAFALADVLESHAAPGAEAALAFDEVTRAELDPWYGTAVAQDRAWRSAARAAAGGGAEGGVGTEGGAGGGQGEDDDAPDSASGEDIDLRSVVRQGLLPAAAADATVLRAFLRAFNLLEAPTALVDDADVVARVLAVWQERQRPSPPPGLSRPELLARMAEAMP